MTATVEAPEAGTDDGPLWVASRRHRPVRTPTIIQVEAVECGAASLGMVLAHFGRFETLEVLRTACGVSRDGTTAAAIADAAEGFGLTATGHQCELQDLVDLPRPAIIHWQFHHFVVFEGYRGQRAQINDPAIGRRLVSAEEFDESFTGIAITFEPTEEFRPGGRPFSVMRSLGSRTRRVRGGLALAVLAGIIAVVPGLVAPALSALFVDEVLANGNERILPAIVGGLLLAAAVRSAATGIQHRALVRVQTVLALSGSTRFLWRLLRLPMAFFGQRSSADLVGRMASNTTLAQLVAGQLSGMLLNGITALAYAVVMVVFSWELALVAIVLNLVSVAALQLLLRRRAAGSRAVVVHKAAMGTTTYGALATIETVKAVSAEGDQYAAWAGHQAKLLGTQRGLSAPTVVLGSVPAVMAALTTAAIIVLGGHQIIRGELSPGALVALQSLAVSFAAPIQALIQSAGAFQSAAAQLERLDDVLDQPPDPLLERIGVDGRPMAPSERLAGAVELVDVEFGYARLRPPLITGLSLRLEPGRRVALVGASGAGKSTVLRLLTGLEQPWSGQIFFDGRPRDEHAPGVIDDAVAIVSQDVVLFEGTIRDNLTLFDTTVPDDVVRLAASDAGIHADIVRRPGGYEARVEERGRNFSGGQCQRLELARALALEPRVLVLDEATSALDPVTEAHVDRAIRRRGCTTVIVAHRLSTVRDADEIIVLHHGAVVERGTHEELLAADGRYAQLVSAGGDVGE